MRRLVVIAVLLASVAPANANWFKRSIDDAQRYNDQLRQRGVTVPYSHYPKKATDGEINERFQRLCQGANPNPNCPTNGR